MSSPTALVIGARGALGSLTVAAFERAGWRVLRGSRSPVDHPDARVVDVADTATLLPALAEADVVVSTVHDPELNAERAVLSSGGLLLSASTQPVAAVAALADAVAAGAVVMNSGLAPGVTNLVAGDLLRLHPEADALEIAFTVSALGTSGSMGADFVHRGLTGTPRHQTVEVPLPEPFGTRECIGFAEEDRGWLASAAQAVDVRPYLALGEPEAHAGFAQLNDSGGLGALPREAFGAGRPPGDDGPSREPVAHWIAALAAGRRLAARTVECQGDYAAAAASIEIMAAALHAAPPLPGAHSSEDVLALEDLRPRLEQSGIAVVERPVG